MSFLLPQETDLYFFVLLQVELVVMETYTRTVTRQTLRHWAPHCSMTVSHVVAVTRLSATRAKCHNGVLKADTLQSQPQTSVHQTLLRQATMEDGASHQDLTSIWLNLPFSPSLSTKLESSPSSIEGIRITIYIVTWRVLIINIMLSFWTSKSNQLAFSDWSIETSDVKVYSYKH